MITKDDILTTHEIATTMDEEYGDGSDHKCCPKCGFCVDCGDCEQYGCGLNSPTPDTSCQRGVNEGYL